MSLANDFELLANLAQVPDPRRQKSVVYPLHEILFIALCGAIGGCDTWREIIAFANQRIEWLRRFVPLANGVPSHDTFTRVFAMLDSGRFAACLLEWTSALVPSDDGRVVAIDGKTLANSFDAATGQRQLQLVSAWSVEHKTILGQLACEARSNEIEALPRLLDLLDVNGAIVTVDAAHCQKETARKIVEVGGDYNMTLKGNQPTLQAAVEAAFGDAIENPDQVKGLRRTAKTERQRGHEEVREYWIMPAALLPTSVRAGWKNLTSIGMAVRRRIAADGSETGALRYFVSSRRPNAREFASAVRGHWSIENDLHWHLDVTFTEDACRSRAGNAAETTALLRRIAVSKLQQDIKGEETMKLKRKSAGWSTEVLERILLGNNC